MKYFNNFNLSKEAKEYAEKLIKEAKELKKRYGGLICKSNVKLTDDMKEIEGDWYGKTKNQQLIDLFRSQTKHVNFIRFLDSLGELEDTEEEEKEEE